jgi:hypothetical protein
MTVTCPSCGAKLRDDADAEIPGVTQIDPAATAPRPTPRSRGLIGWLSGDYETTESLADKAGVEPPTDAVKQEMLRLEMEALRSEMEAEAGERAAAEADPALADAAAGEPALVDAAVGKPAPVDAAAAEPEASPSSPLLTTAEHEPGGNGAGS